MTPEVQAPIDKTARHRAAETARTSRETDAEIMRKAAELASKVQRQSETIAELVKCLRTCEEIIAVRYPATAKFCRKAIAKADAQQQPATTSEGVDWTLQTR